MLYNIFYDMSMIYSRNMPKAQTAQQPVATSTARLSDPSIGRTLDEKIMTPHVEPSDASGDLDQRDESRASGLAAEAHRQMLVESADRYLAELIEEVGEPSAEAVAEAKAFWDRIQRAQVVRASE